MTVITISRQIGSGGDEIAWRVCELLGYNYFDKRLLLQVAAQLGLSENEIVDFSVDQYKMRSVIDHLLVGWRAPHSIAQSDIWQQELLSADADAPSPAPLDQAQTVALVENALQVAYEEDNIVIVGRGGQAVLAGIPGVLHVRIEAPLDVRATNLHQREGLSLTAAHELAQKRDRASADYLHRFYHVNWADSMLYHFILNTGKLSVDTAVQLIINAVALFSPNN